MTDGKWIAAAIIVAAIVIGAHIPRFETGRYQLAVEPGRAWRMDTTTGETMFCYVGNRECRFATTVDWESEQ